MHYSDYNIQDIRRRNRKVCQGVRNLSASPTLETYFPLRVKLQQNVLNNLTELPTIQPPEPVLAFNV